MMDINPKYAVGDVVLTKNHVDYYGPDVCNQLCIVRQILAHTENFEGVYTTLYKATLISTGAVVDLFDEEIADEEG